jgi:signal transduction histidine kinase
MSLVETRWRFNSTRQLSSRRPLKEAIEISRPLTRQGPDEFMQAIVDACVTSIAVVDEFGMVLYASKAWRVFEQSTGATRRGYRSRQFIRSCLRQHSTLTLTDDIKQMLTGNEREFHRQYCHPSHGNQQPFLIHGARLDLPGSIVRVLISCEDIRLNSETRLAQLLDSTNSERKRAENALRDISARLIAAQEEERKRVARELHDDFNQRLGLVAIELSQIEDEIADREILKQLQKTRAEIQQISADVHSLSYRLHPAKLEHLGLAGAIRSLCKEISKPGKLKVSFLERELPHDVPKDITLCLFRITQELLRNCVKHSGAHSAHVYLRGNRNSIYLLVSDNGCGFDPKSELLETGLGFVSMRERAHLVGADLKIFSKPHNGTRIAVSVPLKRDVTGSKNASRPTLPIPLLSSKKADMFAGGEKVLVITA